MTLAVTDLACRRGGRTVFAGLSFTLPPGEALVLRGPNGCGKSTLIRLLAGLLPPMAGRITWNGADIAEDGASYAAALHLIGHLDAVKAPLTVRENLDFAAAVLGGTVPDLEPLDLRPLADVGGRFLSSGQRRRTALSRLFAAQRPLWLLDEPAVGLDASSRGRLEAAIARHRAAGGAVVIATHGDVAVSDPLVLDFAA